MKYILTLSILFFTCTAYSQSTPKKSGSPQFEITYYGKSGGALRLFEATIGSGIIVRIIGTQEYVTVLSYEMAISKGDAAEEAGTTGYQLSPRQKKLLSKLTVGSNLYFSDVKIKLADGTTKKLKGISFKIN